MTMPRRILLTIVSLAFTCFSAAAAAPAHTHEVDEQHGAALHIVSAHHEHHDLANPIRASLSQIADVGTNLPQQNHNHDTSFHFHEIVHFVSADFQVSLGSKIDKPLKRRLVLTTPVVSGDWDAPRRPPRTHL